MIVLEAFKVDDFIQHKFSGCEFFLDLGLQGYWIRATVALNFERKHASATGKEKTLAGCRENGGLMRLSHVLEHP